MANRLKIQIDEGIFNEWALEFHHNFAKSKEWVLYGGAGSGKSYAVATHLVIQCLQQRYFRCIYLRKVHRTIRNSQFLLFKDIINTHSLQRFFSIRENDMIITCTLNGNQLIAAGSDKVEKLKSIQEPNCIWLEEATEFAKQDLLQLKLRIRTKKAHNYIILTFNPVSRQHWLYEYVSKNNEAVVIKTTYLNNKFVDEGYHYTMEALKEQDEVYYNVYALGEWGSAGRELIYERYNLINNWSNIAGDTFYGLDFGFTNPTALVECKFVDGALYVKELLYKTSLTNAELIKKLKEFKIDRYAPIYCDAAEPNRIEEIYNSGFNALPCDKDVSYGIQCVKQYPLYIESGSANFLKEISNYKWQTDKYGNIIERPVKFQDHLMDAMRYAVATHSEKLKGKREIRIMKIKNKLYE